MYGDATVVRWYNHSIQRICYKIRFFFRVKFSRWNFFSLPPLEAAHEIGRARAHMLFLSGFLSLCVWSCHSANEQKKVIIVGMRSKRNETKSKAKENTKKFAKENRRTTRNMSTSLYLSVCKYWGRYA